jgi:hypothetical protein
MDTTEKLVNKVAESGLILIDLEQFFPDISEIVAFDLSGFLFRGLVLREKDFREAMKQHAWENYTNKLVAVFCAADAIIPQWAWMLVASYLDTAGARYYFGTPGEVANQIGMSGINGMDVVPYTNERVILKGCGTRALDGGAYLAATRRLKPVVKSLMFGEPCSTVPVYKKR